MLNLMEDKEPDPKHLELGSSIQGREVPGWPLASTWTPEREKKDENGGRERERDSQVLAGCNIIVLQDSTNSNLAGLTMIVKPP